MVLTNKDIEKLSGVFVTKGEFKNELSGLATKEELKSFKNDILNGQDRIMKKLEDMSIEQKMAYSQDKRQDEKIENHEKRIIKLEEKVLAS